MTAVRLRAGGYTATFRPDAGMLGTSLRFRGEEYVARPEPLARNREGAMTAIALMHPWANRLRTRRYRAAGRTVSLVGIDLPTDHNGLPLHGTLGAAPFVVESVDPARLVAFRLHASDDERFAAFPFPHRLTVEARLDARSGLAISTTVEPTGRRPVPVAFGWHPHLRLPGSGRAAWRLDLPPCERLALDDRNLPTGERTPEPGRGVPLAGTTLDDHFALPDPCAVTIGDGTHRITLRCGPGYGFLQVYAPARRRFVAIEPMTAAIDGLGLGAVPIVDAGAAYTATFTLRVGTD